MTLALNNSLRASRRFNLIRSERSALSLTMLATGIAAALLALLMVMPSPAAARGCAGADIKPTTNREIAKAERATRCLVSRERRKRGLRGLRNNRNLHRSSLWQARDMVNHAYFDHQRRGGPDFTARIVRFGYSKRSNGYSLGENIAWSTVGGATPRQMVGMWMRSPGHRQNILRRKFSEQGIAAVYVNGNQIGGPYAGAGPLVIYVNQFGKRY